MKPQAREDKIYDQGKRSHIELEEEILLGLLDKFNLNGYFLDLGCGTGAIAAIVRNKGFNVFCTDFSLKALKIAQKENNLIKNCIQSDIDSGIAFKDGIFDVIWAGDIIEHLFDPIFVLNEISRTLKKNGALFVIIPNDLYIRTESRY